MEIESGGGTFTVTVTCATTYKISDKPDWVVDETKTSLLEKEQVILLQPEQRTRQLTDALFQERKVHFENALYTSNLPAVMGLVSRGYGISFIFEPHLRHRAERFEIDCYSIGQGRVLSDFVAAYRKGSYLSSYARDYIRLVRELHRHDNGKSAE